MATHLHGRTAAEARKPHRISALARRTGRAEWPILLASLTAAAAIWAFIELADEVVEGSTHALDRMLLLAMRSEADPTDPLGPTRLEERMRDFTALGGVGVLTLLTAGAVGYLVLTDKWRAALAVALAVASGILLSTVIKMGFDRPRSNLVSQGSHVYTASFPSGHSMMAAVVYLTLGALLARVRPHKRVKAYILSSAVVLTVLVGISRVYLGVHWPTDVLAGWAVGAAWALLCWVITVWLQSQGRVETEET